MSKINELRNQRAKAWDEAKKFLETHADENGILNEADTKTYEEMEQKIVNIIVFVRDALWSYGLVFALTVWLRESLGRIRLAFIIAAVFEVIVEVIRFSTGVAGSINLIHIGCVLLGDILAAAFILYHEHALRRKARNTTLRLAEVILILVLFMAGAMLNTEKGISRVNQLVAQETINAQYTVQK